MTFGRQFVFPVNAIRIFLSISIDPMLFLRNLSLYAMSVIKENLKLDRFCRIRLDYSAEECDIVNDGKHDQLQVDIQKLDAMFTFYENTVSMIIPVLLIVFIASWRDQQGRRVPLCLSLIGSVLYAGIYFLEAFFPSWPPEVLLVASFLQSLGGGWVLFYMAAYSYIADCSSGQSRTLRLTLMSVVWQLGGPVGTALGAWLYDVSGYLAVFGLSFILYCISLVYSAIIVKDNTDCGDESMEPKERG
ncbi:solute carrier family 46 member 3-like [Homarus americanus]|uniref:solute carrier family 46 member 3-like n=1 Tax=Homarus americanus TaxID=6706 RepID=UPI001C451127|nr:solute carrier family 46 member 3-like [Homarus americanus]